MKKKIIYNVEITAQKQPSFAIVNDLNETIVSFGQEFDENNNVLKILIYFDPNYLSGVKTENLGEVVNHQIYRALFFTLNKDEILNTLKESGTYKEPENIPNIEFIQIEEEKSFLPQRLFSRLAKKVLGNFSAQAVSCGGSCTCGWWTTLTRCSRSGVAGCTVDEDCPYFEDVCVTTGYECNLSGSFPGACDYDAYTNKCTANCPWDSCYPTANTCYSIPDVVPTLPGATPLPTVAPVPTNPWVCGVNFGVRNTAIVYVFEDVNGNGVWEDGEPQIDVNASSGTAFLASNPRAAEAATTNTHLRKS